MKMRVGPIFSRRTIFSNKTGQGADIFSEHFGPRTVISGTKFPVTGPLQPREATCLLIPCARPCTGGDFLSGAGLSL